MLLDRKNGTPRVKKSSQENTVSILNRPITFLNVSIKSIRARYLMILNILFIMRETRSSRNEVVQPYISIPYWTTG